MKSIAQEFALEVQERKDRGKTWDLGHFDSGQEPMGFEYRLLNVSTRYETCYLVKINTIEIYNDMAEVVGHYDKKQLAEFIAAANEQLMGCIL